MTLLVQCSNPACGESFAVPDVQAAHSVRCRFCGTPSAASAVATAAGMPAATETQVHGDLPADAAPPVWFKSRRASKPVANGTARPEPENAAIPPRNEAARDTTAPAGPLVPAGSRVGRFEIVRLLGRGAFGAVYLAKDPQLDREVALKLPHPGVVSSPQSMERVMREAKACAQLRHPNIVPVFDAGLSEGQYYIASAYIKGETLERALSDGPLDARRAARIVMKLAFALDYAHSRGIIHRDVKPANIVLDADDEPHLMDFGLARLEAAAETLTQEGALLGTPAYMSPEQAAGTSDRIGPASDQYSLGVILYELLSGTRPFTGPAHVVIFNVIHQTPMPLRSHVAKVATDLEVICGRAIEKNAASRYAASVELALDLQRWLSGEPIHARRAGRIERAARWCRRNAVIAALSSLAMLLLCAVAGIAMVAYFRQSALRSAAESALTRERSALSDAEQQRRIATRERDAAAQARDGLDAALKRAQAAQQEAQQQTQFAVAQRDAAQQAKDLESLARTEAEQQRNIAEGERKVAQGARDAQIEAEKLAGARQASSMFRRARSLYQDREFCRALLMAAASLRELPPGVDPDTATAIRTTIALWRNDLVKLSSYSPVNDAASGRIAPDGHTALVWDTTGRLAVLRTLDGEVLHGPYTDIGHSDAYPRAYSPFSHRLVRYESQVTPQLIDLRTGKRFRISDFQCSDFDRSGNLLATSHGRGMVTIYDAVSGTALRTFQAHSVGISTLALNDSGSRVATFAGGTDPLVRIWNTATGSGLLSLHHPPDPIPVQYRGTKEARWAIPRVKVISFSPDDRRLLTVVASKLRIWDLSTGQLQFQDLALPTSEELTLEEQVGRTPACFSPDSSRVLTGNKDRTVIEWDVATGSATSSTMRHRSPLLAVQYNAQQKTAVTLSASALRQWDLSRQDLEGIDVWEREPTFQPDRFANVRFSGGGSFAVLKQHYGSKIVDLTKAPYSAYDPLTERITDTSADGQVIAYNYGVGVSVVKGNVDRRGYGAAARSIVMSADGKWLLAALDGRQRQREYRGKRVVLWDLGGPATIPPRTLISDDSDDPTVYPLVAMSQPSAVTLAVGGAALPIHVCRRDKKPDTPKIILPYVVGVPVVHSLAISPDDRVLAIGGAGTARLWDLEAGETIGEPLLHDGIVTAMCFSSDGTSLATGSSDGFGRLWDCATGARVGAAFRQGVPVEAITFSTDGRYLFTGGPNTLKRWTMPRAIEGDPERIMTWSELITGATLVGDEIRLLTAAEWAERKARLDSLGGEPQE